MRTFWTQGENPVCDRSTCHHPLRGTRKAGHFNLGDGPCKAMGCSCEEFLQVRLAPKQQGPSRTVVVVGSRSAVAPPLHEVGSGTAGQHPSKAGRQGFQETGKRERGLPDARR